MVSPRHDHVPEGERSVTQDDLRELRGIVRDLGTVLSSVVHIMERDARATRAPEPRQELLGVLLDQAHTIGERLDPERAGRR